jgi:hypothetical protein
MLKLFQHFGVNSSSSVCWNTGTALAYDMAKLWNLKLDIRHKLWKPDYGDFLVTVICILIDIEEIVT